MVIVQAVGVPAIGLVLSAEKVAKWSHGDNVVREPETGLRMGRHAMNSHDLGDVDLDITPGPLVLRHFIIIPVQSSHKPWPCTIGQ
jgi:hypothetical protein